eukprot:gnl/Trimastix_PCT/1595.p2 GENE.gnl/Trimastix_PCT/1595~~gnl/Trimastix_PCT/1595.p2  ORF type:complete len:310 (-),score=86.93 gnl/Trimastix_PCT/1595:23-952(-)
MPDTLYADRPEWNDITPIPQDDGPNPVTTINYSAEFIDVMGYFRAILQKGEVSERAFELTRDVIDINSANYTAWAYRRMLIEQLEKANEGEFAWTEELAYDSPKNYQVWFHRQWLVEHTRNISHEMRFLERALEEEEKNYHAWSYRQWLIDHFQCWDAELDFVERRLQSDHCNNSAWNHRWYVIQHTTGLSDPQIARRETEYAMQWIRKDISNESPWNYLTGLFHTGEVTYAQFPEVIAFAREMRAEKPDCPHPVRLLVDAGEQSRDPALVQAAMEDCTALATQIDTIRYKYWVYRRDHILRPLLPSCE